MKKYIGFILVLAVVQNSFAELWLPSILSNNMVLQQHTEVTIWGWTTVSNEIISIRGSWDNIPIIAKAYQGKWSAQISTPKSGGIYTVTISGHEKITIKNVLIGEVWLCSGQSNMQWTPQDGLLNAKKEIKNANYPNIRFFQVQTHSSAYPQDNTEGHWVECTPETMKNFSSVAYFFGRKLHRDLNIPVGLINSSWAGTPIETWIEKTYILKNKELSEASKKTYVNSLRPNLPGQAYNTMIYPIVKFSIAGCIWYQGESNCANALSYYKLFPLLISSWRGVWGKKFPFYFVQIAPFKYGTDTDVNAAIVRDAQLNTMRTVSATGMVVTNDIGNLKNIHPIKKQEVGKRLALWALANNYEENDIIYSGPVYKSMEIKKRKIILHFNHAKNGLIQKGKELTDFFISGADKTFHKAKAKIVGNTVVVYALKVKKPVAVRFAFSDIAQPNLFNKQNLPATAFRTDQWKIKF